MTNRYYSDSFKLSAVRQVLQGGESISQVARNNKITNTSLRRWIEIYNNSEEHRSRREHTTRPESEIEILKQHLREVTKERDILKSALLIIASDTNYKKI